MAQLGTIKLQTASGPVELPVFDTADAGNGVYDMVRVQTAGGVGFVPFVSTGDAAHPYLRIQTQNNGVLAAHNEASMFTRDLIDGFEDGSWSDNWTQSFNNGNISIKSGSNVISGNYSAHISDPAGEANDSWYRPVTSHGDYHSGPVEFKVRPYHTGSDGSKLGVGIAYWRSQHSNYGSMFKVSFANSSSGNQIRVRNTYVDYPWVNGNVYTVRIEPDWNSATATAYVDGDEIATSDIYDSQGGYDAVEMYVDSMDNYVEGYIDDISLLK